MSLFTSIRTGQLWLRGRRTHYRMVFGREPNMSQTAVLNDLREFCFASKRIASVDKDGKVDPLMMLLHEGRREVWMRIERFLNLSDEAWEAMEKSELNDRVRTTHQVQKEEEQYA